jgi:hypothetical protein
MKARPRLTALPTVIGLLGLLACSDDATRPPAPPPASTVTVAWEYPWLIADLIGIWGSASDDIYAVGSFGKILHYDGIAWLDVPSPTRAHLSDIWGVAADHIVAVGSGPIVHYDGTAWREENPHTDVALSSVWGCASDSIYAVGWRGTIRRFDGTAWTTVPPPTTSDLGSIWGTSGDDIYVGAKDALLHYDGSTWTDVGITVRDDVIGIWGSSPDDVWATDGTNFLWHYDGSTWQNVVTHVGYPFMNFWGFAKDDIFASGWDGLVSHFDGTAWSGRSLGDLILPGIWGTSGTDIWVCGLHKTGSGVLFHYDGSDWADRSGENILTGALQDIWSDETGDHAFAVGRNGMIAKGTRGTWTAVPAATSSELRAVWGASPDDVFAAGYDGAWLHFDGNDWNLSDLGAGVRVEDLWGTGASNVYAASSAGLLHYDGDEVMDTVVSGAQRSVWGTGASNVFVAGRDPLYQNGVVRRFDGVAWNVIYFEPDMFPVAIAGTGPDDVVMIAFDTQARIDHLLQYHGTFWDDLTPPELTHFRAVGGNAAFGLVVSGFNEDTGIVVGNVLRWHGGQWEPLDMRYSTDTWSIWGGLASGVYMVTGGAIVRCRLE